MTQARSESRHLYLSYHSQDEQLAQRIKEGLRDNGILSLTLKEVVDQSSSFNAHDTIIERDSSSIKSATVFCCLISPSYQGCLRCKAELHLAVKTQVPVVPVYVKRDWRPCGWLSEMLCHFLWIDFRYAGKVETFTRSFQSLVQEVIHQGGKDIISLSNHTLMSPKPREGRCLKHARNRKFLCATTTENEDEESVLLVKDKTKSCFWKANIEGSGVTLQNIYTKEFLSVDTRDEEPVVCSVARKLAISHWYPVQDLNNVNGERAVLLQHCRTGLFLSAESEDQLELVKNYSKSNVWYVT